MANIQIVKMDESILRYFEMVMNLQNESEQYRDVTINEFKGELEKSLNCGIAKKEIVWVEQSATTI